MLYTKVKLKGSICNLSSTYQSIVVHSGTKTISKSHYNMTFFFRILNLLANWKLIDYLAEIHGNSHISNPTSKFFWLHCAAGLGRATRGVWGRLISIIGSALRNSNLDLVTSAELNQAARLDGDATHCGTTCEKLDRIIFLTASTVYFFGTQVQGSPKNQRCRFRSWF